MQGTERTHNSATRAVFKQHTRQTSEVNKDSWAAEISGNISLVDKPLPAFFREYVPCNRNLNGLRPWANPAEVFAAVPSSGRETKKYPELLHGLRKLVSGFEKVRRPKFADGSKCAVTFPYKDWEEEHHYTLPDILMSFPGECGKNKTWAKTWHRIAMVCEVKNADDPINESAPWPSVKQGANATGVLTQLAKSARNLMLTHGMLFVFVVGIYKDSARIYRFDRAACVVSKSFNIKTTPWPLHELLLRICHYDAPVGGLPEEKLVPRLLAEDPTFSKASEQEKDAADQKCKETGQRPISDDERRACRWVTVAEYDDKGKVKRFANRNDQDKLPSSVFLPHEIDEEGSDVLPEELEALLVEAELDPAVGEALGIAYLRLTYGDDLGAHVVADRATRRRGDIHRSRLSVPRYNFYHRTISSDPVHGGAPSKAVDPGYNERSHMRLVFETVGRPLSQFKSTKGLIKGMRDAIYGHRQAYLAGIIHRDISENNMKLSDDIMSFFFGFLLDLDYGFNWKEVLARAGWEVSEASWKRYVEEYDRSLPARMRPAPPETEIPLMGTKNKDESKIDAVVQLQKAWLKRMKMKERTGTLHFMAIEILETYVAHDASVKGKIYFLARQMTWEVVDNPPLTKLVRKFKELCHKAMSRYNSDTGALLNMGVPLTYESVMALFDDALASPDWPQNDRALPFKMPSKTAPTASQAATAGSRGEKRQAPDEPDPLSLPAHKRAHFYRHADDSDSESDGSHSDGDEQAANDA
ncbi:hypothetical protein C8Q72DRAFT_944115 [Fomitopsis betulina]|nr:hypothetical protein C8Q72DRAFT_944115 [Fomitopsis betulina]